MSTLEVLQSCPSQRNALLEAISSTDSTGLTTNFALTNFKPCFPYHVSFQIEVVHAGKTIRQTIIYECESTCVMFVSCWKDLGSLELVPSNTLLIAFNGRSFRP